ncbi:carbohydrate ABC transporter permease [Hypericibacter sp.]|uniref:carbohydrate ABC transporter permease n=1 Tax=Hypericibacter sp. TaxID=2705401 RepID=UPI003D6D32B7
MTAETTDPATTSPVRRTRTLIPFNVALVLPAQLTMLAVVLAPTLIAIWLSLTDWQPTNGTPWYLAEFYWFWNFNDLWFDTRFINSLWRTALVVVVAVGFELVIALGLALLFLDEWPWRKLAVSILILPMMIVPVDAANAFFMLFNDRGPINHLISLVIGRDFQFSWLSDPDWALAPIIACEVWQWTPLMFLLLLTGLMNLPQNQVRAALALGASPVRIFFRIMLPLLMPVILVALLIRSIETFKIFDAVYILTRGGPGSSTETISMYMYNGAFVFFRIGYIAAAGLIVLVLVISLCLALAKPLKRHHG